MVLATDFSGAVGLGVATFSKKDNLSYDKDTKKIDNLNSKPKKSDKIMPLPIVDVSYGDIYLKTDIEEFDVKLGYNFDDDGSVYLSTSSIGIEDTISSFSYGYKIYQDEMYKNPYLTGVDREKEKSTNQELQLALGVLQNLNISYNLTNIDIDDDSVNSDARQSGNAHEMRATLGINSSKTLEDSISLIAGMGKYDGESNDYTKYGLEYELEYRYDMTNIIKLSAMYTKSDFDKVNSYFDKRRDEKESKVSLEYTKVAPFGYKDIFVTAMTAYSKVESNIDFFDKDMQAVGFAVGYKF
jgi:hypothetical protein